jgi:osmotically-inducible protein OsmY
MIENIENNKVPDILKQSSAMQSSSSNISAKTGLDASLQVSYDSLIEHAKQIPREDASVVQRARELLLSGQLDNPENARAAAEAIVKFGI